MNIQWQGMNSIGSFDNTESEPATQWENVYIFSKFTLTSVNPIITQILVFEFTCDFDME